jgi:ligand-binding sensor domain-containing protein/signal transduction histidine kinase
MFRCPNAPARKIVLFFALFLILPESLYAQRLNFTKYGPDEGLPQSQVLAIHQDRFGYLWFGTYAGVSRFDGRGFFTLDSSNGLPSNSVSDIAEDNKGRLYFATLGGGIAVYDGYSVTQFCAEPNLLNNNVTDILMEGDSLWAATDNGLTLIKNNKVTTFEFGADINAKYATVLFRDSCGTLWIGTEDGLYKFLNGKYRYYGFTSKQRDPQVNAIIENGDELLIGTSCGLSRLAGDHLEPVKTGLALDVYAILCAFATTNGDIWFGSDHGAILLSNGKYSLFSRKNGLANNTVNRVLIDNEKNIWFGTDSGISKLVWGPFAYLNHATGLLCDSVFDVFEDSKGRLWIACVGHGFSIEENGKFSQLTPAEGLPTPNVTAIVETKPGEYLIGTDESLCYWDGRSIKVLDDRYGVTHLYKDSQGRVWIGSNAGPDYWFKGALQGYKAPEPLYSAYINCTKEDKEGRIWFGTNKGAIVLDKDGVRQFCRKQGFTDLDVWSIDVDREGGIWLGTNGDGAYRYFNGKFTCYSTDQGLNNNFIWQVLADSRGNIWLGTNAGLNRFDGREFTHFTKDDGLAENEGFHDACIEDSKGILWFCSGEGLSCFDEKKTKSYEFKPPVYLTRVLINGRSVPFRQFNEYPYVDNQITFSFVGLSYRKESAVRYRYKLDGLDNDWSESTSEGTVRYAKIPPGYYTFHVKASSTADVWSEKEAVFSFRILTPFYLSWWFPLLSVLMVAVLSVAFYRWRMHTVRRINEELERKVQERTKKLTLANKELEAFSQTLSHDFNAPLRNIEGYASILLEDYGEKLGGQAAEFLKKIIDARKKLKSLIQDLLRFSQSTSLPLDKNAVDLSMLIKMILSDISRAEPKRRYEAIIQPGVVAECSENLIRLSLYNMINNAWKYTKDRECARIEFGCVNENGQAIYFIRDNGIGFKNESKDKLFAAFTRLEEHAGRFEGTGLGLVTVKRIIERHGGRVWAEGKPGEGASFYFTLNR